MTKRIPLFLTALLLSLCLAAPHVNAAEGGALATGVPNSVITDANNRIVFMNVWVQQGWLDSGIPLVLNWTLSEILGDSSTKDYAGGGPIDEIIVMIDDRSCCFDKGEALGEITIPPTDPVEAGSKVDACVQLVFVRGNGMEVPFGDEQCVLFDF